MLVFHRNPQTHFSGDAFSEHTEANVLRQRNAGSNMNIYECLAVSVPEFSYCSCRHVKLCTVGGEKKPIKCSLQFCTMATSLCCHKPLLHLLDAICHGNMKNIKLKLISQKKSPQPYLWELNPRGRIWKQHRHLSRWRLPVWGPCFISKSRPLCA